MTLRHTILIAAFLAVGGPVYAFYTQSPDAPAASDVPEAPGAPEAPEAPELEDETHDIAVTRKELELTPEIVDKLDADHLHELLKEKEITKRERNEQRAQNVGPEIAAPLGFFFSLMVIVFLPLFFGWRRQILLHETLRAMVEKGVEIPVELITPQKKRPNDLRRGVVLIAIGLGLSIFLALLPDVSTGVWACGLIPLLMGAGYLVVWRLQPNGERAHSPRE